jgi:hypothetical protein
MPMDLFTPETMDGVVRVLPQTHTFFRDTFFSTTKPEYTEKIRVDFVKGKRKIAPFVNIKDKAGVIEKRGYITDEFETPVIKIKDVTTIEDMLKRLPGELLQNSGLTPYDRGIQLMAEQLVDFEDMIARREEWMCVQAMMEGKIPVVGEGVNYEIDFGFTNKSTVATLWNKEGARPHADLQTAVLACKQKGYRTPNICIMERSAYNAFIEGIKNDDYFKNQKDIFDVITVKPERRSDAVTFVGRLRDPDLDLYVYDEWFIDDWSDPAHPVEKSLMPKGKILLASTTARYSLYYGLMMFTDPATGNFRQVVGTRAADSWIQKDPDARFLTLNARPLPVPHEVDSWYVLTVSETE